MTKYIMYLGFLLYTALSDTPVCQAQTTEDIFLKKGAVLGFHFIKPKEGEDAYKHEAFLKQKYFPSWRDAMPGSQVYYLKGERGMSKDKNTFLWVFKDLATRDRYWPEKDVASEEYIQLRAQAEEVEQQFDTTFQGWESDLVTDYLVIATGKPVKKDWLQPGAVVGLHYMKLKPDVDTKAFEKFIQDTWAPNRSDAVPGSKVFFLKGIRGENNHGYAFLWILDSEETRNRYFPQPDQASEEFEKLQEQWQWLSEENYLGQFFEGWDSERASDFIVVL